MSDGWCTFTGYSASTVWSTFIHVSQKHKKGDNSSFQFHSTNNESEENGRGGQIIKWLRQET